MAVGKAGVRRIGFGGSGAWHGADGFWGSHGRAHSDPDGRGLYPRACPPHLVDLPSGMGSAPRLRPATSEGCAAEGEPAGLVGSHGWIGGPLTAL